MRVLMITQTYPPEMGALSNRMYPVVKQLASKGHEVFVATGMPNYPAGVVFPAYRGKSVVDEHADGAAVLRTSYRTAARNQSKKDQLASYLSFVRAAYRSGRRAGKVDVVFVTSPPLFPVLAGRVLARLSRCPLIFDIRDLWPDEIVACGAAKESSAAVRLLRRIELGSYRSAALVTCTTRSFIETVVGRGVPRQKAAFLPNGADLDLFKPMERDNDTTRKYPFEGKFVVMYSGLLGIKHGLETMLDAAAELRDRPEMLFVFVGNGARKQHLMSSAAERGLSNVLFTDEQPLSDLPALIAGADVCVSSVLPDPYLEKIISVKVFEYLACERPTVAAQRGETASIVEESGGGLVVPPGDGKALAQAITELYENPRQRAKMGMLGREYVEANYSRAMVAERLESLILETCSLASPPKSVAARAQIST